MHRYIIFVSVYFVIHGRGMALYYTYNLTVKFIEMNLVKINGE